MNPKVCILDYGSGNVRSVFNLLKTFSEDVAVSNDILAIKDASHVILPGVGSFNASMRKIKNELPMTELEHELFVEKKPFLGICVGMQVMANRGLEFGDTPGLGWIKGVVDRVHSCGEPLPHIGWNNVHIKRPTPLLNGLEFGPDFYFVHSYAMKLDNENDLVATTEYGENFPSIVQRENLIGVQFHPEKSQDAGRRLIANFLELGKAGLVNTAK